MLEKRICRIYDARPEVCLVWPTHSRFGRCVYFGVRQFERERQGAPHGVPLFQITSRR